MKSRKNIRAQKRLAKRFSLRSNIASWTNVEFNTSFKAVRDNYFDMKKQLPESDLEKALYVTIDDLNLALKEFKKINDNSLVQIISIDEKEINSAYKKLIK